MAEALQNIARGVEKILPNQVKEGDLTKKIERQTAKIPSLTFLNLALGSMALSLGLEMFKSERKDLGTFVGEWVPTFLLFGIYNKLVKLEGSDWLSKPKIPQKIS